MGWSKSASVSLCYSHVAQNRGRHQGTGPASCPCCLKVLPYALVVAAAWYCAAAEAETAATAAAESAAKAQSAQQVADSLTQDAEKWAAAAEGSADTSNGPTGQAPAAAAATTSKSVSDPHSITPQAASKNSGGLGPSQTCTPSTAAHLNSTTTSTSNVVASLQPAEQLPAQLAICLHEQWSALEREYVGGMGRGFAGVREAYNLAVSQVSANRSWLAAVLQQPDNRQALLKDFLNRFNAVELDMRNLDDTKVCRVMRGGMRPTHGDTV